MAVPAEEIGPALETLAGDACRLAARLVEAAGADAGRRTRGRGAIAPTGRLVRALIAARRLRSARFGPALAPEPGWSVLLVLYMARLEGRALTQARLTEAAAAPGATIAGRLAALEAQGLVHRRPDPARARGTLVALTDEAVRKMGEYLREAGEI